MQHCVTGQGSLGRKDGPEADGEARGVQPQQFMLNVNTCFAKQRFSFSHANINRYCRQYKAQQPDRQFRNICVSRLTSQSFLLVLVLLKQSTTGDCSNPLLVDVYEHSLQR